jgi:hypothetical protein
VRSPLGGWGPQTLLDTGGYVTEVLAEPAGAVAFLVEAGQGSGGRTARFTVRNSDGTVVGPSDISPPDACGPLAAMNLRGDVLATWCRPFNGRAIGTRVDVRDRPAGGSFGPEVPISGYDSIESFPALNDAGQAALVWLHYAKSGDPSQIVVQASVREDPSLPALPFPPAIDIHLPLSVPVGNDGSIPLPVRCNQACNVSTKGILFGAGDAPVAAAGSRSARLKARRRRSLRLTFGAAAASQARAALGAGKRPWASVSVTAKGRSPRPVTLSRRVRLRH